MKNINEMSALELQGIMFGIDQSILKLNQDKNAVAEMWKKKAEEEKEEEAKKELEEVKTEPANKKGAKK